MTLISWASQQSWVRAGAIYALLAIAAYAFLHLIGALEDNAAGWGREDSSEEN